MTKRTYTLSIDGNDDASVTVDEIGTGQPIVLLHGGAGPQSVAGLAQLLADTGTFRVLTPTHPGFGGTPRPDNVDTIGGLARLYVQLFSELELDGVTVVGNSIGGWIAAEIALLRDPRIRGLVLIDAAGLQLAAHPIVDFFSLTMDQIAELSYYDPTGRRIDVAAMPAAQRAIMGTNRQALQTYGGTAMADPGLLDRLPTVITPTLVIWGEADRMIPTEHAAAYAAAIPGAELHLLSRSGHLPQLEQPAEVVRLVCDFATTDFAATHARESAHG